LIFPKIGIRSGVNGATLWELKFAGLPASHLEVLKWRLGGQI